MKHCCIAILICANVTLCLQSPGAESVFAEETIDDDFFTAPVPTSFLGTPLSSAPPTPLTPIREDDKPELQAAAVKVDVERDEDTVDTTAIGDKRFLLRSALFLCTFFLCVIFRFLLTIFKYFKCQYLSFLYS